MSKREEVMSSEVVGGEVKVKPKESKTKPKTLKKDLEACRRDYESGNYRSIVELASKYGLNHFTLKARLTREKWVHSKIENLTKLNSKIEEKVLDLASEYLKSSFLRTKRFEGLIDASIEQNATDPAGRYVVAPSDLDAYTRSEARVQAMALSALRVPSVALDVKTGGQDIGTSIVSALEKLRATGAKGLDITSEQVDKVLDMEIISDRPNS